MIDFDELNQEEFQRRRRHIAFVDFWPGFDDDTDSGVSKRWFAENLVDVEVVDPYSDPAVIVFSCFGHSHQFYKGVKLVCYIGENLRPPLHEVPLCLSFDHVDNVPAQVHTRLPLWLLYRELPQVVRLHEARLRGEADISAVSRTGFCSWVASNERDYDASVRLRFVRSLSERYREVACGGKCLNNVGGPVADKQAFLRRYRFNVAFENASHPGYCTEKLLQAFAAGCVPIYWGDPLAAEGRGGDFNPRAMISAHDCDSLEELADRVAAVDGDPARLEAYLREPILSETWYAKLKDWRGFCESLTELIFEGAEGYNKHKEEEREEECGDVDDGTF